MGRGRKFTETESWCPRCKAMLPRSEFYKTNTRPSGVQSYCIKHFIERREKASVWRLQLRIEKRRAMITQFTAEIVFFEAEIKRRSGCE